MGPRSGRRHNRLQRRRADDRQRAKPATGHTVAPGNGLARAERA